MSIYAAHLDRLVAGETAVPPVVANLELGTVEEWAPGYAKKTWPVNKKYFTAVDVFGDLHMEVWNWRATGHGSTWRFDALTLKIENSVARSDDRKRFSHSCQRLSERIDEHA